MFSGYFSTFLVLGTRTQLCLPSLISRFPTFLEVHTVTGNSSDVGVLRLIQEELQQEFDDIIVQTDHLSILHAVVQLQTLRPPQQVFPRVVGVDFHGERQSVELVAEEGEELSVCNHGLRHEGSSDVFVVPET